MFDSGVGGLSVLREFRALASAEDVIYFADTLYFPYGPRPAPEVRKRAFGITSTLLERGAKAIVVACNTASAAALADLRQAFDVPFVGVVPGLKPATRASRNGRVVILATPGTLDGELYARVVSEFGAATRITSAPGHGLAELVEAGRADGAETRAALRRALDSEVEAGADTVVLGCTHYHFLRPAIEGLYPGLSLIDTSEPVARRALQVLRERGLARRPGPAGSVEFMVSGDRAAFERAARAVGFEPQPQAAARR